MYAMALRSTFAQQAVALLHSGAWPLAPGGAAARALSTLPATLDTAGDAYARSLSAMTQLLDGMRSEMHKVHAGGGDAAVKRHRARGKLLPRERIDALLDPGSPFLELSPLAGDSER